MTSQQAREKLEAVVESCVGDGVTEVLDAADVLMLAVHVEACGKQTWFEERGTVNCGETRSGEVWYCDKAPRRNA